MTSTSNVLGTLSTLPANLKWSSVKGLIGNPSTATVTGELKSDGLAPADITAFLSGKTTVSQLIATQKSFQVPTGGSVNPSQIASTVSGTFSSITNVLGSLDTWKGLGLIIAGGLILVFAAIEFKNLAGG